jgi:prophage antirepressor-like protein
MTPQGPTLPGLQQTAYWFTVADCCSALGCSLRTVQRHLLAVPATDKVLVTRRVRGSRTTRYWRISPNGLRIMGHRTGQAPYL